MGCKIYGALWYVHVHIATEVIQLPDSRQQACFINTEVWEHLSLSFVAVKEQHCIASSCIKLYKCRHLN